VVSGGANGKFGRVCGPFSRLGARSVGPAALMKGGRSGGESKTLWRFPQVSAHGRDEQPRCCKALGILERDLGGMSGIVNCAAICNTGKGSEDLSCEGMDAKFDVNVKGIVRICRRWLPLMRRSGGGRVEQASVMPSLNAAGMGICSE